MTKEEFKEQINRAFQCYMNSVSLTEQQLDTWYEWFTSSNVQGIEHMIDEFINKSLIPPQSPFHIVSVAFNNVITDDAIVLVDMTVSEVKTLIEVLTSIENKEKIYGKEKSDVISYLIYKLCEKRKF